jgi:hypothetical protein
MSAAQKPLIEGKKRGWNLKPNGPGERNGGRQKGSGNRVNRDIKEMVVQALSEAGGVKYLVQCAHKQPVAFLGLVGRVLPLTIAGKGEDGAIPISFEWAPAAKVADDNSKFTIDVVVEPMLEQLEDDAPSAEPTLETLQDAAD